MVVLACLVFSVGSPRAHRSLALISSSFISTAPPTNIAATNGTWLTRTSAFRKLCKWAFDVCDSNGTGSINKTELYACFLLVHLNLAKYAGPAACYPAPRSVVDALFEASDDDKSGGIDENEFISIMMILCSQIASRILAYYSILILLVPYITRMILVTLDIIGVDDTFMTVDKVFDSYAPSFLLWMIDYLPAAEAVANRVVSLSLFFLVIPSLFNYIDEKSQTMAEQTVVYGESSPSSGVATTTTATTQGEKKEE